MERSSPLFSSDSRPEEAEHRRWHGKPREIVEESLLSSSSLSFCFAREISATIVKSCWSRIDLGTKGISLSLVWPHCALSCSPFCAWRGNASNISKLYDWNDAAEWSQKSASKSVQSVGRFESPESCSAHSQLPDAVRAKASDRPIGGHKVRHVKPLNCVSPKSCSTQRSP